MNAIATQREAIERYYQAMEAGSREQMDGLFADEATYIEPFSQNGAPTPHVGREAIVAWLAASFEQGNRGLTVTLDRLDIDGDTAVAEWTCTGPTLPGPMKGHDRYRVAEGRITSLETRFGPAS